MLEDLLRQASLTVTSAAALLRDLVQSTWFRSVDVTGSFSVGTTSVRVRHGLGRAFNGAVVVGTSAPTAITVDLTEDDSENFVTVRIPSVLAARLYFKLRVY